MIFAAVFATGCSYNGRFAAHAEPTRISAWLAYWDLDAGEKDLAKIGDKLEKLSYFGAYFDKNGRVFVPQELSDKKRNLDKNKGKYETYLTFVNDRGNPDGSIVVKDKEIIGKLFADDASMTKHIDEIIALTLQGGYSGVEIDYERIWTDEKIGRSFVRFVDALYAKARKNNLKLRVVLEPGAPFAAAGFSPGPEYVVMFYNLYGLHSGPGPKADRDFILKTLKRMKFLPGEKSAAFATGGCEWGDNDKKKLLTELEAKTRAEIYGRDVQRDEESQCVFFTYDFIGVSYTVWYADGQTLNYWIATAKEQGENNISLWRLGGNPSIGKIK